MAWTIVTNFVSPNWEKYGVSSDNAADTVVVVPHTLGRVPLVWAFCSNNAAAAAAEVYISDPTDVSVQVNKKGGVGAGAQFCLNLSTLRHPH